MNNIITLPKFIELLAQASDRDQRLCERFVTEFIALVSEGLATDGIVKIKGLGHFRQTNESGKPRVEFVPDREVSDFINAPFLFFEPTVLSDDVNEEVLRAKNQRFDLAKEDTKDVTSFDLSDKSDGEDPLNPMPDFSDDFFGQSTPASDTANDNIEDSADPFDITDPFADTLGAADPLADPFDGTDPLADTLGGADPLADPFDGTDPLADTLGGADPLADAFGGTDPLADTIGGVDPFADTLSGADPFADTIGGPDPSVDTFDSTDPLADTIGASDPFADTLSGADPFADTLGGADPFADTIGGPDPSVDTFDSTEPLADTLGGSDPFADTLGGADPFADTLGVADPFADTLGQSDTPTVSSPISEDDGLGDFGLDTPASEPTTPKDDVPLNSDLDDIDAVLGRIDISDAPAQADNGPKYGESDTAIGKGREESAQGESTQGYTSRWSTAPSTDTDDKPNITQRIPDRTNTYRPNNTSNNRNSQNPYDKYDYEERPFPWLWLVVALLVGLGMGFAAGILFHDKIVEPTVYQNTDVIDNVYFDETEEIIDEPVTVEGTHTTEPVKEEPFTPTTPTPKPAEKPALVKDQQPVQTPKAVVNEAPPADNSNPIDRKDKKIIRNEPLPAEPSSPNHTPATTSTSGDIYDTISADCMISDLARKYYGNTAYWVYIYLENSDIISNPNNLREGLRVKIPPKSKYDVSTNEEENIKAAKNMSRELFAKFK